MKTALFVLTAALLCLTSCDTSKMLDKIADDDKEKIALDYIDLLRGGDHLKILDDLSPELKKGTNFAIFKKMAAQFPSGDFKSRELIGYRVNKFNNNPAIYNITYQYEFDDKWLLTNVLFSQNSTGKTEIKGFNVQPLQQSLQDTHKFSFSGKGIGHYLIFAACILAPIFIVVTLIVAIRTKMAKRKWLWIIFILLGVASINLNWTTGQLIFQPLSFQLLGFGFQSSGLHAPWILGSSIPLGAILFWILKYRPNNKDSSQT